MSAIPITVTGTIATEPMARTLPSGRACASFRLAVNHWKVDRETGEFLDDGTSWFGIDTYGDLASNSSVSLRKGTAVIVSGSLRNREWETKERSGIAPTVVADHIGPDLRFGTAHFRRAKGPDRPENQPKQAPAATAVTEGGGWAGLGASGPDPRESAENAPSADASRRPLADGSGTTDTSFGTGDRSGDEDDNGEPESVSDSSRQSPDDAAIAAKTAAAAGPF